MTNSANTQTCSSLVCRYLESGCNFDSFPFEVKNQSLKLLIFELMPEFWVADSASFIPATLTRKAYGDLKRHNANMQLHKLRNQFIIVSKWSLIAQNVESNTVMASHKNVQVVLVIDDFKLCSETATPVQTGKIKSLFQKDERVKALISGMIYKHNQETLLCLPKAKDLVFNATSASNTLDFSNLASLTKSKLKPIKSKALEDVFAQDQGVHVLVDLKKKLQEEALNSIKVQESYEDKQIWVADEIRRMQNVQNNLWKARYQNLDEEIKSRKVIEFKKEKEIQQKVEVKPTLKQEPVQANFEASHHSTPQKNDVASSLYFHSDTVNNDGDEDEFNHDGNQDAIMIDEDQLFEPNENNGKKNKNNQKKEKARQAAATRKQQRQDQKLRGDSKSPYEKVQYMHTGDQANKENNHQVVEQTAKRLQAMLNSESKAQISPLSPLKKRQVKVGVNTQEVKQKLLKILNHSKRANRPPEQESKKIYSTEDLPQNHSNLLYMQNSFLQSHEEPRSQLPTYIKKIQDEEDELTETEKDEEEEELERKRVEILNKAQMNFDMFKDYLKWQKRYVVTPHPLFNEQAVQEDQEMTPAAEPPAKEVQEEEDEEEEEVVCEEPQAMRRKSSRRVAQVKYTEEVVEKFNYMTSKECKAQRKYLKEQTVYKQAGKKQMEEDEDQDLIDTSGLKKVESEPEVEDSESEEDPYEEDYHQNKERGKLNLIVQDDEDEEMRSVEDKKEQEFDQEEILDTSKEEIVQQKKTNETQQAQEDSDEEEEVIVPSSRKRIQYVEEEELEPEKIASEESEDEDQKMERILQEKFNAIQIQQAKKLRDEEEEQAKKASTPAPKNLGELEKRQRVTSSSPEPTAEKQSSVQENSSKAEGYSMDRSFGYKSKEDEESALSKVRSNVETPKKSITSVQAQNSSNKKLGQSPQSEKKKSYKISPTNDKLIEIVSEGEEQEFQVPSKQESNQLRLQTSESSKSEQEDPRILKSGKIILTQVEEQQTPKNNYEIESPSNRRTNPNTQGKGTSESSLENSDGGLDYLLDSKPKKRETKAGQKQELQQELQTQKYPVKKMEDAKPIVFNQDSGSKNIGLKRTKAEEPEDEMTEKDRIIAELLAQTEQLRKEKIELAERVAREQYTKQITVQTYVEETHQYEVREDPATESENNPEEEEIEAPGSPTMSIIPSQQDMQDQLHRQADAQYRLDKPLFNGKADQEIDFGEEEEKLPAFGHTDTPQFCHSERDSHSHSSKRSYMQPGLNARMNVPQDLQAESERINILREIREERARQLLREEEQERLEHEQQRRERKALKAKRREEKKQREQQEFLEKRARLKNDIKMTLNC